MSKEIEKMKKEAFASGTVPEGYFGNRCRVLFTLRNNHIIAVHDTGCFNTGLPEVLNEEEAMFVLNKHPEARNIKVTQYPLSPNFIDRFRLGPIY